MQTDLDQFALDPIEGVDYAFDYFAFINHHVVQFARANLTVGYGELSTTRFVDPEEKTVRYNFSNNDFTEVYGEELPGSNIGLVQYDSAPENIELVINRLRTFYHQDWDAYPGPLEDEFVHKARVLDGPYIRARLEQAAILLLDPRKRGAYTDWLNAQYIEENLVIMSHESIYLPADPRFSFNAMFGNGFVPISGGPVCPPSIADIQEIEDDIRADPQNEQHEKDYRDALAERLAYLNYRETREWEMLGFKNLPLVQVADPLEYTPVIHEEIELKKTEFLPDYINKLDFAVSIGMTLEPFTTGVLPYPAEALGADKKATLLAKACARIDERAPTLLGLAQEKAIVLEKLSLLAEADLYSNAAPDNDTHFVLSLSQDDKPERVLMAFEFNAASGVPQIFQDIENLEFEKFRNVPNLHIVRGTRDFTHHYPSIEPFVVMQRLRQEWLEKNAKNKRSALIPPSA